MDRHDAHPWLLEAPHGFQKLMTTGFNGGALSVVSGFGAGEIFVSGASYNSVNVENSG